MTNLDRLKLLELAASDLKTAVVTYEKAKSQGIYVRAGVEVPLHCSKTSIQRRITQIRQDLLLLEKGL